MLTNDFYSLIEYFDNKLKSYSLCKNIWKKKKEIGHENAWQDFLMVLKYKRIVISLVTLPAENVFVHAS